MKFTNYAMNARNLMAVVRKASARAQAAEFLNWGVYLVILGLVLAFGSVILSGFATGLTGNAANTITYTQTALATIAQYLPDVALVVVASGMILLLVRGLVGAVSGGRGGQI